MCWAKSRCVLYLLTGGFFLIGYIYDFWTLNDQITVINARDVETFGS